MRRQRPFLQPTGKLDTRIQAMVGRSVHFRRRYGGYWKSGHVLSIRHGHRSYVAFQKKARRADGTVGVQVAIPSRALSFYCARRIPETRKRRKQQSRNHRLGKSVLRANRVVCFGAVSFTHDSWTVRQFVNESDCPMHAPDDETHQRDAGKHDLQAVVAGKCWGRWT